LSVACAFSKEVLGFQSAFHFFVLTWTTVIVNANAVLSKGKSVTFSNTRTEVDVSVIVVWIKSLSWMIKSAIEKLVISSVRSSQRK
jgi:hypothetical protein